MTTVAGTAALPPVPSPPPINVISAMPLLNPFASDQIVTGIYYPVIAGRVPTLLLRHPFIGQNSYSCQHNIFVSAQPQLRLVGVLQAITLYLQHTRYIMR